MDTRRDYREAVDVLAGPSTPPGGAGRSDLHHAPAQMMPELIAELMHSKDEQYRAARPTVAPPSRRKLMAEVGKPLPWGSTREDGGGAPATPSASDRARQAALRNAIVSQLSRQQGVPDPTQVSDVSTVAEDAFVTPYSSTPRGMRTISGAAGETAITLPIGERVKQTKPFGKRVFEGGIPAPPSPTFPPRSARFGKRMNIEQEAKRRAMDAAAVSGRKPDKDSIFSAQYALLRNGTLNVDAHKPCMRITPAAKNQRSTCVPGLPDPLHRGSSNTDRQPRQPRPPRPAAEKAATQSETRSAYPTRATTAAAPAIRSVPAQTARSAAHPRDRVYAATATGDLMQRAARPLVPDPSKIGRPLPQTIVTIADEL